MLKSNEENINYLVDQLALTPQNNDAYEKLVALINHLINNDFNTLVQLLYKVDVDEKGLQKTLHQNKNKDAAVLITELLIERERQKKEHRFNNAQNSTQIPDDEKW